VFQELQKTRPDVAIVGGEISSRQKRLFRSAVGKTVLGQTAGAGRRLHNKSYRFCPTSAFFAVNLFVTKGSFRNAATVVFTDSRSITWHQWQVNKPMLRKYGLFPGGRFSQGISPRQTTPRDLCACCREIWRFLARKVVRYLCGRGRVIRATHKKRLPGRAKGKSSSRTDACKLRAMSFVRNDEDRRDDRKTVESGCRPSN